MMNRIISLAFVALFLGGCTKEKVFNPELAIDQRAVTLSATSDTARIVVYSSGSWTVENRDNASWINLSKATGSGTDYAVVSVADNSTGFPRASTLVVKSGAKSDTIRLGQKGIVPQILITATSVSSPATGGNIQTAIDTNIPLNMMNVTYNYAAGNDWISGLQIVNKTLVLSVQPNTTAATRSAKIYMRFLDAVGTTTQDSLTVNQAKP